jgi:hypothetical protein
MNSRLIPFAHAGTVRRRHPYRWAAVGALAIGIGCGKTQTEVTSEPTPKGTQSSASATATAPPEPVPTTTTAPTSPPASTSGVDASSAPSPTDGGTSPQELPPPPSGQCYDNDDCAQTEFCMFPASGGVYCGRPTPSPFGPGDLGPGLGDCRSTPDPATCPTECLVPGELTQCGCDGNLYCNTCLMSAARVSFQPAQFCNGEVP